MGGEVGGGGVGDEGEEGCGACGVEDWEEGGEAVVGFVDADAIVMYGGEKFVLRRLLGGRVSWEGVLKRSGSELRAGEVQGGLVPSGLGLGRRSLERRGALRRQSGLGRLRRRGR